MVPVQHQVVRDGIGADETVLPTIFGNVAHSERLDLSRRPARRVAPEDLDGAGRGRSHARQRLHELALPVPLDTCDADDLTRPHL